MRLALKLTALLAAALLAAAGGVWWLALPCLGWAGAAVIEAVWGGVDEPDDD